ncbi:MAG: response regulator [Anaerolineae bacterium]|nr:response regulator [Anaerolineae bacterium]
MSHRHLKLSGKEPGLGGRQGVTGREPSLSREFSLPSGPFRIKGLEAPSVPGRRRPLVVLMKDDPDIAEITLLIADSNGYDARLIDADEEAWQTLRAIRPDLFVTSLCMSYRTSPELIRRIRADEDAELQSVPVLVMEIYGDNYRVMDAFNSGADDYLMVPCRPREMLHSWRRLLSTCRRPSPLTALQNEDAMIREVALSSLLARRPDGLVDGLSGYLWHPDRALRAAARWALRRVGTDEALAALQLTMG